MRGVNCVGVEKITL